MNKDARVVEWISMDDIYESVKTYSGENDTKLTEMVRKYVMQTQKIHKLGEAMQLIDQCNLEIDLYNTD